MLFNIIIMLIKVHATGFVRYTETGRFREHIYIIYYIFWEVPMYIYIHNIIVT